MLAGVFTVPGDGALDWSLLLRLLADAGYEGWAVVEAEQDPVRAPPLEYGRLGRTRSPKLRGRPGTTSMARRRRNRDQAAARPRVGPAGDRVLSPP